MTKELEPLYEEYIKMFGGDPSGYENANYGDINYNQYVTDIKRSLELGVELPELYPDEDDYDEDEE